MSKKFSKADAEIILKDYPQIQIIEWRDPPEKSVFKNVVNDRIFEKKFSVLRMQLSENKNLMPGLSALESIAFARKACLEKFDGKNPFENEDVKQKIKKTNLEKYGYATALQNHKIKDKATATLLEKYGVENCSQADFVKQKKQEKSLQIFGTNNVFQNEQIKEKIRNTLLKNYGVASPLQNEEIKAKALATNIKRYGFASPLQNEEIKAKFKATNIKRYGGPGSLCSDEVKQKSAETRIKKGLTFLIGGKTLKSVAKEKGIGYTTAAQINQKYGAQFLLEYESKKTVIEQKTGSFLTTCGKTFISNKGLDGRRPDFLLEKEKFIIECDGLYWHSDAVKTDKNYHKKRKDEYEKLGYSSLFFREDEILGKFPIIESIVKNKLKMSQRIFARKCRIEKRDDESAFFEENHLMDKGSGRIYCLIHESRSVAAIQVKWKNKTKKILEISRFCTKNGISVVGGFSKLISYVEKEENPNQIITFIDKRYGDGRYLSELGFEKHNSHTSFSWTDFKTTYHRMNFPGNSGYAAGMFKIWDCGQEKWIKKIT